MGDNFHGKNFNRGEIALIFIKEYKGFKFDYFL